MKKCRSCGFVFTDDMSSCMRCSSASLSVVSADEVSLFDSIQAAYVFDKQILFDEARCLSFVADFIVSARRKKELAALKAAFHAGAIAALKKDLDRCSSWSSCRSRARLLLEDAFLQEAAIDLVLDAYGNCFSPSDTQTASNRESDCLRVQDAGAKGLAQTSGTKADAFPNELPYVSGSGNYRLIIESIDGSMVDLAVTLASAFGLPLLSAKAALENLPVLACEGISADEAFSFGSKLEGCGATISLIDSSDVREGHYDLILESFGDNKIATIKVIRQLTGLGLKEAKALVESTPVTIASDLPVSEIEAMKDKLVWAGASVFVRDAYASAKLHGSVNNVDVILNGFGNNKIAVIKAIRELTGLGLKESKELVESAPVYVKRNCARYEADAMCKHLNDAGASAKIVL